MAGERSNSCRYGHGRERRSSSLFSIFNVFRTGRGRKLGDIGEDMWDEAAFNNSRRVRHSDEDKECWIAEPDIDRKASAFIARFYESRVSEPEIQTIAL